MGNLSILIVGAGITGVSAAEWLRRDGHDVTLIDPVYPGDSAQTSYGNAGLLARTSVVPVATPALVRKAPKMVFDPASPLFLRWSYLPRLLPWLIPFLRNSNARRIREIAGNLTELAFDTTEQHMALSRGTGADAHITMGEFVNLYRSRADHDADTLSIDIRREHGLEPEFLSRAELTERDPHLGPDYTFGTMVRNYGWLTSPGAYVKALFAHFCREGGQFRQSRVVDIKPGETPVVTLEGGDALTGDRIVLSAGAWSAKLARAMGAPVLLEAERGYHVSMYGANHAPPNPYMVTDGKFVVTPMDGFLRAAGVAEFAGVDAPASDAPNRLIEKGVKKLYPNLTFERAEKWMGRRPTTPDSMPVIGESPKAPNVLHAYGGQHIGLTIGPKLGRIVSDMVSNRRANTDLAPYRPDRF